MKTLGLIGGIGCASTEIYYDTITRHLTKRLGPGHTGYLVIYSINEHDIYSAVEKKEWDKAAQILIHAAQSLEKAGEDFMLICSNLFHRFAEIVQKNCKVPLLHILDPICEVINREKYKKIGLIGTRLTMTENSYSGYLLKHSQAEKVITPNTAEMEEVNDIIFKELLSHIVNQKSKNALIRIIHSLQSQGADCLILGCTELSLILSQKDLDIPVLDSAKLHAIYAAEKIIAAGE